MSCSGGGSTANAAAIGRAFCNQTPSDLGENDHLLSCGSAATCPSGCIQAPGSCSVKRKRIATAVEGGVDTRLTLRNGKIKYSVPDMVSYSNSGGLVPLTQPVPTAGVVLQSGTPNVNAKGAWNMLNYQTPKTAFYHVTALAQVDLLGKSAGATHDRVHFRIRQNGIPIASVSISEPAQNDNRTKQMVVHFSGQFNVTEPIDVFAQLDSMANTNQNVQASLSHILIVESGA